MSCNKDFRSNIISDKIKVHLCMSQWYKQKMARGRKYLDRVIDWKFHLVYI